MNGNRNRELLVLLLLLAAGLFLRLAYVRLIEVPPYSDMADYETLALNMLEGKGLVMNTPHLDYKAYRPPLYPLFLAACYKVLGPSPERVRIVQCSISTLTVALVYLLAFELFRDRPVSGEPEPGATETSRPAPVAGRNTDSQARKIALVAAALFCFDETSIFFCGQLLTETLFTFLLVLWSWLIVRTSNRPNLLVCTFLGIVGGAAVLTRPVFGPLLLFGVVWFFRNSLMCYAPPPKDWNRFSLLESPYAPPAVILVYAAIVVSVWGFRNQIVLGHFVPVSTNGGVNFYIGHNEDFGYASFGNKEGIRKALRWRGINDEVLESRFFALQGLEFIRNHPWQDLKNSFRKIYYLYLAPVTWKTALMPWRWWNYLESPYRPWPWEHTGRKLRFWRAWNDKGQEVLPTYRDWFFRDHRIPLVFWGWPMLYLTGIGVFLASRRHPKVRFLLGTLLVYTLTLVVYFTNARFRTPMLPFLYTFAAYTLVRMAGRFKKE